MNLVTSQFDKQEKSVGALTARNQVLRKEIDRSKRKGRNPRSRAAERGFFVWGKDKRIQAWQVQYAFGSVCVYQSGRPGHGDLCQLCTLLNHIREDTSREVRKEVPDRHRSAAGLSSEVYAGEQLIFKQTSEIGLDCQSDKSEHVK